MDDKAVILTNSCESITLGMMVLSFSLFPSLSSFPFCLYLISMTDGMNKPVGSNVTDNWFRFYRSLISKSVNIWATVIS